MAQNAEKTLACRRKPRTLPTDEASTSGRLRKCLRAMRVPNPRGILSEIQTQKEDRLGSTCEWILKDDRFSSWAAANKSRLLRLVGPPGIGKTMVATFLAETIQQKVEKTSDKMFAYFFFDNKGEERRRTPTAMLRSLIWQLLLQNESLFRHVEPDFERHEKRFRFEDLFERFSTMWLIFQDILQDEQVGEVFILIDALDECDKTTRKALLKGIKNLFDTSSKGPGRFKFLITHRSEISDIERNLSSSGTAFRVNSTDIDKDLKSYIDFKTEELANLKEIPKDLKERIRNALITDSDGTFLWVSLMTAELGRDSVLMHRLEESFNYLPSKLDEIYVSILDQIPFELQDVAQFILHSMVAARRPFTKMEIMTAFAASLLAGSNSPIPLKDDIQVYQDILSTCSSIIIIQKGEDEGSETLRFCHQSVKDFLLSATSQAKQQWFNTTPGHANLVVFQACWRYFSAEESKLAHLIIHQSSSDNGIYQIEPKGFQSQTSTYSFLRYGTDWWQLHAVLSYPAVLRELEIDVKQTPPLRDVWALREAQEGQASVLGFLIDNGVDTERSDNDGMTLLSLAASHGNVAVVELLLSTDRVNVNSKNETDQTPLSFAAMNGHASVVELLLATGKVDIDPKDLWGETPFFNAVGEGHRAIVEILLATEKVDLNIKDRDGRSALSYAALGGHIDVIKLLFSTRIFDVNSKDPTGNTILSYTIAARRLGLFKELLAMNKVDVDSADHDGLTPLSLAISGSQVAMAELLLATGKVDVDSKAQDGRTPLLCAASSDQLDMTKLLLATGKVDVNPQDRSGSTPLSHAAFGGSDIMIEMLLATGKANLTVENYFNHTPLTLAATGGCLSTLKLLLAAGKYNINSQNRIGRTILSYAALTNRAHTFSFLLSRGASDTPDSVGRNPLMFAALRGAHHIVSLYLTRNLSALDEEDHYGSNALSLAIRHDEMAVARLLLDTGRFSLDSEDRFGRSLLWWARISRSIEIEHLLLDAAEKIGLSLCLPDGHAIAAYMKSVASSRFNAVCTVCTLILCSWSRGYHICEICIDGKFSICQYCYDIGGRCLDDDHELIWMNAEMLRNQRNQRCKGGPGDRWY
ncbi:uncharacterized protein N7506_003036 [Penicillium brevicompactum]|uniref:uncharacterized protein n=1 Tax=Penicillium brevicompactum TaxID=5074 RepID=UPI0025419711|nr:uncharacterized protein N7506_003036 [Penicillium brevicompactum]KAJ5343212.1 hypothetical protein N7506_003036 [Penicillium brevicompactum]